MFGGRLGLVTLLVLIGCGDLEAADSPDAIETSPAVAIDAETATGSADVYTPTVVLAVPESAGYARPDVVIKLLFSMPMDTEVTATAFSVVDIEGNPIAGSLAWDASRMVSAFRPDQPLAEGDYRARVGTEACNADGVELDLPFVTEFHVTEVSGNDKPYAG